MSLLRENTDFPILNVGVETIDEDWQLLLHVCNGYLLQRDLEKLKGALGRHCRTIIIERKYYCKDYRDTYTNFYAKKFAKYPETAMRLFFFEQSVVPSRWWEISEYADSFIGYSVIRPTRIRSLGRTVLDPRKCANVNGYLSVTSYAAHLFGVELTVLGFPYISQDSDVTICAHAACWMCFRYLSERDSNWPEVYPFQITQLTTDFSKGRLVPSNGLFMTQVSEMLARYGLSPEVVFKEHTDKSQFYRSLYAYVESGLPVIVSLKEPAHAVVAIGHVSRFESNDKVGCIWTSEYVTGLVVNDDNHMPYQIIPSDASMQFGHMSSTFTMESIDSFVVPLYEKIHLAAEDVEDRTYALLEDPKLGIEMLSPSLAPPNVVRRQFLTSSRAYRAFRRGNTISESRIPHNLERLYTETPMPKYIWVTELSTRDLYSGAFPRILGEIIWDATASERDPYAYLLIHYPEYLIVNDRDSRSTDESRLTISRLPGPIPYRAYCDNLKEI